ncbi:MAG: DUF349 domain-containing protein [Sphingobacteriales bacterium]|nr:MAG: DUF349 domain-containing protein [Sphingobacteriales bacterium]
MKETAIARLEQLIQDNNPQVLRSQYKTIRNDFNTAKRNLIAQMREVFETEWKERLKDNEVTAEAQQTEISAEAPEKPKFDPPTDPLDDQFEDLLKQAETIVAEYEKQLAAGREQKLAEKKQILENLTQLAHSVGATGIGETFKQFNALQDSWKSLGNIDDPRYKDMQLNHSYQVDLFYHNVNLMKEMRELDFKLNLERKNIILDKMQQLTGLDSIPEIEALVKELQHEWKGIGPVANEVKDEVNQKYREVIDAVYSKIRTHYGERKLNLQENLLAKKNLIEQIEALLQTDLTGLKNLQDKTEQVIGVQEAWKKIGPSEQNEELWHTFRETCDKFFEAKQLFFKSIDQEREKNKLQKIALCEKAEALQHDHDWKHTTDTLVNLQKEWKEVGPAKPSEERKLWDRFRSACDRFFEAKKEHFSSRGNSEQENLEKKLALIAKVEAYEFVEDRDENFRMLQEIGKEWKEIGFVPIKEKERLQKTFSAALDEKYEKLKLGREQRIAMKFKSRVESLAHSGNVDNAVKSEQQAIKNRITELQNDIAQYENNLGFFTNAKPDNPLLKEVRNKIEKLKNEVDDLKHKLKMLTQAKEEVKSEQTSSPAKAEPATEIKIEETAEVDQEVLNETGTNHEDTESNKEVEELPVSTNDAEEGEA